jgi:hypothetical protein
LFSLDVKPSPYADLDPIFREWAAQHSLHTFTDARDEEVRVTSVVDDTGDTYQIWLTPCDGAVAIDAALLRRAVGRTASRERRTFAFHEVVPQRQMRSALDRAFNQVRSWISQAGHSRTPLRREHLA